MPIRISIVSRNAGARLAERLNTGTKLVLAGSYPTGEAAVRDVPIHPPDLLLVDADLPCMNGFECVRWFRDRMPHLPILMFEDDHECGAEAIFAAVHAGASGCLPGGIPAAEWTSAIREIFAGARHGRRKVLMLFNSDRKFASVARHWAKMAGLIDAGPAVVTCEAEWRRVVMTGKKAEFHSQLSPSRRREPLSLLPSTDFSRIDLAVSRPCVPVPPERAMVGRMQRI